MLFQRNSIKFNKKINKICYKETAEKITNILLDTDPDTVMKYELLGKFDIAAPYRRLQYNS